MWRWINPDSGRWYEARLERDLLDGLVVVARWGGSGRAGVGMQRHPVTTRADVRAVIARLHQRRRQHRYADVRRSTLEPGTPSPIMDRPCGPHRLPRTSRSSGSVPR